MVYDLKDLIGSQEISALICLPLQKEPEICSGKGHEGFLIGFTERLNLPLMFHIDDLVNPHMLICGMTGGGKTFLARSIASRASSCGFNLLIIDFTGEYSVISKSIEMSQSSDPAHVFGYAQCSVYLDLHNLGEQEKATAASHAFDKAASAMRKRDPTRPAFILIDEAWKLIESSKSLEVIIREGRKYGVGLITSSQLLHDTNQNILSNMATLFIFKTTNAKSLDALSKNFGLLGDEVSRIVDLDRGSCLAIQLRRSGARNAFVVKRVAGVRDTSIVSIDGAKMSVKMSVTEFEEMVASLCGRETATMVMADVKNDAIALRELISKMLDHGAKRRMLLLRLQKMGFGNAELADSFSAAISARDGTDDQ